MHSRSLTRLGMSMLGGPAEGNALRLVGLPELRFCQITNEPGASIHLRVNAESLAGVPKLQALKLWFDDALDLRRGALR